MTRRGKMAKKNNERRVYTQEFKSEAEALAEKKEKPISQVAKDLGLNENVLRRWIHQTKDAEGTTINVFPGHGRPRDVELIRLRKEVKALRNANEILKKAAVIFAMEEPL
jgi:transposase